jgi:acetyl-CoA acetyltransferase
MARNVMRDAVCMAGIGTTAYGNFPQTDSYGLGAEALVNALDDCGLDLHDVDGLIVNRIPSYERFAEMMNVNPRFCLQTDMPGRFSGISLMLAAQWIVSGAASVVALVYGNNGRSQRMLYGGGDGEWSPWGMSSPGAVHAMMFRAHMAQFGTRPEDLGHVAVAFRRHAVMNPSAVMRKPITLADHDNSRFICEPLRLLDYCLINDGAVAWIMTSAARARDLKKRPVYVAGYSRQDVLDQASFPRLDYWYPTLRKVEREVYANAGVSRDDIDGLMIYDNFSPTVLFSLEGMGFCKQGESGDFVKGGMLEVGRGRWPTNTSGGHLSESYMQGWGLIAEAVRQLRGECGDRQIRGARAIQYICATNLSMSIIFRRD